MFYDSVFVISDFGLVDYPGKLDISKSNETIGPKWTMAPEMRRDSFNANGEKADVYSFAKTLWIALTGYYKGFDGQYSVESILNLKKIYSGIFLTPIDEILSKCTDNDPYLRPSVSEISDKLQEFIDINSSFHLKNNKQWIFVQNKLFPLSLPSSCVWTSLTDIINILNLLSSFSDLNHVFLPGGGGYDLDNARLSDEPGCLEFISLSINVMKPKCLMFESFGTRYDWNYFRLELDTLEPSYDYKYDPKYNNIYSEEVAILDNGKLIDPDNVCEHNKSVRYITRWLGGSLVIFNKRSVYNQTPETYDGRHNKMDYIEFRKYIDESVKRDINIRSY